ncbi:PH domain-containing protein [Nocardiopsis oceani]
MVPPHRGPGVQPPPPPPLPKPEDDVTSGVFRAHWLIVPLQILAVTLVFVALVGPILTQFGFAWVLVLAVAVVFGSLAYALPAWWFGTFGLRGDHLVVHSGLLLRSSREIPLSRLQAVDVVRPLLMQVFGLAELRVELAGGDGSAIRLRCVPWEVAEKLRVAVLAHAAGLPGRAPEAPEWPFYRLPFALLLGALTFRVPVLLALIVLLLLATAFVAFLEPGVLGGAIPLILGLLRYYWGPLARYTDFYASLSSDGVRLRYGMFQRRMQTVPPGRVQAVRVVEPLLWRALGVARVEATVAGYAGARQGDSADLLPVVPRRKAFALVNEMFPDSDAAHVPLVVNREMLSNAAGVDARLFVSVRGIFCRVTEIVPVERMQVLRLSSGPLSQLRDWATVHVETPPGPVAARAADREAVEGRRFMDALLEYGRRARVPTAGTERWATRATMHGDAAAERGSAEEPEEGSGDTPEQ